MTQPVLDMTLKTREPEPQSLDLPAMLQGLALNPDVPVDKLEKIIELHERLSKQQAKAQFDEAFAEMQRNLPVIMARKKTTNGTKDGKYAPLEDIMEKVRPILADHGFSISHRNEFPAGGLIKTIGTLAHRAGFERSSEFVCVADKSGAKNDVQALGSAMSYGRRYTTNDLLNIVTRNEDDDAKRAAAAPEPEGYADWVATLATKANEGLPALQAMWALANKDLDLKKYAAHLGKYEPAVWNELKIRAAKVVAQ